MFRRIQQSRWAEFQTLRIAMAVRIDVAADAVNRRVVGWNRTVEVEPKNFSDVRRPIVRGDLSRRGQVLRLVRRAVIRKPVAAVVAARQVQLLIRTEYQPASAVIIVRREICNQVERVGQRGLRRVVRVSTHLQPARERRSCIHVVRVCDVHVIAAGAFEEIGMKGEAQDTFVPALTWIVAFVDGERRSNSARRRIDSNQPAARAFGDPELIVWPPYDFPRRAQPAGDDAERERRLRGDGLENDLRQRRRRRAEA